MNLKTLRLTLKSDRPVEASAAKLRGFFATRFNEYALLHQHIDVDKLLYRYPRIQYKILEGAAIVLYQYALIKQHSPRKFRLFETRNMK